MATYFRFFIKKDPVVGLEIAWHHFWSVFLSFDFYIDVEKLSVVGGGWSFSIMSALVLFWPWTLNLSRTLDQDQDPSLIILKMWNDLEMVSGLEVLLHLENLSDKSDHQKMVPLLQKLLGSHGQRKLHSWVLVSIYFATI